MEQKADFICIEIKVQAEEISFLSAPRNSSLEGAFRNNDAYWTPEGSRKSADIKKRENKDIQLKHLVTFISRHSLYSLGNCKAKRTYLHCKT